MSNVSRELQAIIDQALAMLDAPEGDDVLFDDDDPYDALPWYDDDELVPDVPWCSTEVPTWAMDDDDAGDKVVPMQGDAVPWVVTTLLTVVALSLTAVLIISVFKVFYLLGAALALVLWLMVTAI